MHGITAADGLNFELPEEIRMLKEMVRKFVDRELIPIERSARDGHKLKPEVRAHLVAKANELGLAGYDVPREYGGLGMGLVAKVTVWAELARSIGDRQLAIRIRGCIQCCHSGFCRVRHLSETIEISDDSWSRCDRRLSRALGKICNDHWSFQP